MVTYMDKSKTERVKGVKKVLNRLTKPKLMRKKMLEECDVYIYDLHFGDLDDVLFGGNVLDKATLEEQKVEENKIIQDTYSFNIFTRS